MFQGIFERLVEIVGLRKADDPETQSDSDDNYPLW